MTETEILHAMKTLDLTREEAIEMLQEDEAIDHGANPHPLTAEQEKASKQARSVSAGPREKPVKRERPADWNKREIINTLGDTICDLLGNAYEIINPERQIDFFYRGRKYRIILSVPRK